MLARFPLGSDIRHLVEASGILTTEELAITSLNSDATELIAKLQNRNLTSVQCVTAFAKRAAIAHQALECLADFFFEDALVSATILDEYYEREGKPIGPLHGLPISVKVWLVGQLI